MYLQRITRGKFSKEKKNGVYMLHYLKFLWRKVPYQVRCRVLCIHFKIPVKCWICRALYMKFRGHLNRRSAYRPATLREPTQSFDLVDWNNPKLNNNSRYNNRIHNLQPNRLPKRILKTPSSPKRIQSHSSDEIVVFGKTRSEICNEIRTPEFYLEDYHIDAFISIANDNSQYDMITVLTVQIPELYTRRPGEDLNDDLQILFDGSGGPDCIGHFFCIHYRANEHTVYFYDSLHIKMLTARLQRVVDIRYPGCAVEFVKPKTLQPDGFSCGVFAAAYATTIILGEDPAEYPLQLMGREDQTLELRNHMAKMLQENRLSLFPRGVDMNRFPLYY